MHGIALPRGRRELIEANEGRKRVASADAMDFVSGVGGSIGAQFALSGRPFVGADAKLAIGE